MKSINSLRNKCAPYGASPPHTQMGYTLGNTRQSRNVRDTFTKKEKAGGKGRQLQIVEFMLL